MNVLKLENSWHRLSSQERSLAFLPVDTVSPLHFLHVPMEGIDAVNACEEKYVIGTTGLYSCLGLAVYDSISKVGAVAHIRFDYPKYRANPKFKLFNKVPRQVDELLMCARKKGGLRFDGIIVNMPSVWRSPDQNQDLQIIVRDAFAKQSVPIRAMYTGKDPMEFRLDTRTGAISPYWQ